MSVEVKAQNQTALASVKAIYDAATEANSLLDDMQAAATAAGTTLEDIYQDAADAAASAKNANEYAARALGNLSTVQSVTETLNWITQHGTMTLTADVTLDPTHVYFVRDNNGDYHVGSYYYSVVTEPDVADIATYYELTIDESLNNYVATHLSVDSEGLWIIPDAGGNKVLIATGQGSTYTSAGTYIVGASAVLAKFTAGGSVIGVDDGTQSYLYEDYHSLQLIDKEGNAYLFVSDLRDSSGVAEITATFIGDGDTSNYTGISAINTDYTVFVDGVEITSGISKSKNSVYFYSSAKPAKGSVITINYQTSIYLAKAYTLGIRDSAESLGELSAAFGEGVIATGRGSFAEGYGTEARGLDSHAEGFETKAYGSGSHTEGYRTNAYGSYSHACGVGTTANEQMQFVIGEYNDNQADTAFEIGNGDSRNPSNALAVTWDGDVHIYLDDTAASGTDYEIITALTALGWDSDVLI